MRVGADWCYANFQLPIAKDMLTFRLLKLDLFFPKPQKSKKLQEFSLHSEMFSSQGEKV